MKPEFTTETVVPWKPIGLSAGDALSISEEKDLVKPTIIFPSTDDTSKLRKVLLK